MKEFDVIWNELIASLNPGTEIKHWNPYNGYLGDALTIVTFDPETISIDPPRVWETQVIPRHDFERVWDIWIDYLALRLERRKIHALTHHSKYIISILHWYETEC
jgi:hypothetical protein